ncbi:MAG: HAMP domain-containing histidine kinase [Actinobacteria bacterium]|nr:HAMP domain-containing histidine kinase [Actinomycetota bacterium]
MATDRSFAQLVSLACHDLRTPLATVHGFARTIERLEPLQARTSRYVGLIVEGSAQIAELLERLALVSRIERGSYEPARQTVDSLDLVQAAAALVDAGDVSVDGKGAPVSIDPVPTEQSIAALCTCAIRHGDSESLECAVRGADVTIRPISEDSAPILLGDELRDFGAVAACIHIEALGGSVRIEAQELLVRFSG